MRIHFDNIKSVADNIVRYLEKDVSVGERICLNIDELASFVAEAAAKDVKSKDFFLEDASLEPYMPPIKKEHINENTLEENRALCDTKFSVCDAAYVAHFCGRVTEKLKVLSKLKASPALFATGDSVFHNSKVAFSDSKVLTEAFEEFRKKDSKLSPSYVRSFADACEDVEAEVCDYCILPIENSRDGALLTVYGLIERHELFISRVCSVESDEITTKFALLCRRFRGIIEKIGKQYIDLRLSGSDNDMFAKIYTSAAVLGVSVIKTVSVPLVYTDGYAHICTFCADSDVLFAFLLFLSMIRVDYTMIGVYGE